MIDEHYFLPNSRGEVKNMLSGPWKTEIEKICSIISAWKGISPPKGFEALFSGISSSFELTFAAYIKEDGQKMTLSGPSITFSINNPSDVFGMSVVDGIYIKPVENGYFHGFPKFSASRYETVVLTKLDAPLFVPVTREEYLKAMIARALKEYPESEKLTDTKVSKEIEEMERVYRQLLEVDKAAAEEVKKGIEEMKKELKNMVTKDEDYYPALLKKELDKMDEQERRLPAYYSLSAIDDKISVSGLVRVNDNKNADTLVKVNPALVNILGQTKSTRLLTIHFQQEPGEKGFRLADSKIRELMNNELIWRKIYESIK
ncbi:hypothetical protein BRDCF_p661 [Bacteroidales bacterium CF]|jgi:hypothetical protein|nr:hypothetical protein BRDCF_p661 [Bacteroidales bacterium CF]